MIEELLKEVLPELRQMAKAQTVVGEPIQAGESTVIPVSKVSVGFGAGGGEGDGQKNKGSGTGGGAMIDPVAFIVITAGKVKLVPLTAKDTTIGKVIDLVPEILDRVGRKKEEEEDEPEETPDEKAE